MLKTIFIWFSFVFFTVSFGQSGTENYKLEYPKYIPLNSSFDVSLITSDVFPGADSLILYVMPGPGLTLRRVELKSYSLDTVLTFAGASLNGYNGNAVKTIINFDDSTISSGSYFQVLLNFNSEFVTSSSFKIYGIFVRGDTVLGSLVNGNLYDLESNFIPVNLNFYKPQKDAGKSLLLGKGSLLSFSMKNLSANNLLIEFWAKFNGVQNSFLNITSKSNTDFNYSLSVTPFQMLVVDSDEDTPQSLNPYFTGFKSWYHISADISFGKNMIYFYCNGSLISSEQIPYFLNPDDLEFNFTNLVENKQYQIDLLRFVNLNNDINTSFSNRNYINFLSDSSNVISQFDFDNGGSLLSTASINIASYGLAYTISNAPIFARAPELNITPLNSAYLLEWSGGDYKEADYYVLQKSMGNSGFTDLINIPANNSDDKTYSYTDQSDGTSGIVYYRIKQVNLNGSVTYSSQVKVGQGEVQSFVAEQNYPNPFNPKTSIVVNLLKNTQLDVTVYNLEGKKIQQLFKGYLSQGTYTFSFDATDLPSGVYLYKITTPNYSEMKKMILTK